MIIGIEAQRIFRKDKHGMDFVALEFIRSLQRKNDSNQYLVFVAPGEDRCLEESRNVHIIEISCPTYPLWEQVALPIAVRKYKPDMLHCTSNTAPVYCPVPLILTLHDIIYLTQKQKKGMSLYQQLGWHYRRYIVPRILGKCRAIITVSFTERVNIMKRFPELTNRLHVVYNGYSDCYFPISNYSQITRRYVLDDTYLLFLGNTDPRKNTIGVLKAYADYLRRSSRKLKLVVTGLDESLISRIVAQLHADGCARQIVSTGYVPGEDFPALYNGAYAFLYPSFQEGFGIPILESMACGTPVITSNCSAMPEIAGDGGILVRPENPVEIANALLKLEADTEYYKQQVGYGLKRVKNYSWEKTAYGYLEIYHELYATDRQDA
ncbi:MAG: glycosyltransferase family 4 protein [Bacteroides sp.]|jgi:glycosyltransferase involved in cell wall biosynthesis|nr:glycosyltransferase family 4 protein [Bacteroides sp.]